MRLRWSYKVARVWGIPIKVHISLLLVVPFLQWDMPILPALLMTVGVFTTIALHELGHCFVAMKKGSYVREILLLPIGGVAQMESIPKKPRDEFLMAIAGPAVSLFLFVVFFFGGRLFPVRMEVVFNYLEEGAPVHLTPLQMLGMVFQTLGVVNLGWVIFNLIPAFPMDGGRVLRAWLVPRLGRLRATFIASMIGKATAVVFALAGLRSEKWTLVLIAIFVYFAAGQEYRAVERQERAQSFDSFFNSPFHSVSRQEGHPVDEVVIGPPPYSYDGSSSKAAVRTTRAPPD